MVALNSKVNACELLFAALDSGDMEKTNEIMDKHPQSVDARDEEKRVPLHYAADCADLETFQRILSLNRLLMDAQDEFGFTPLLVSVMAGNFEVMEYLMEQGAHLGHLDCDGHSAAHWAVVCGQLDILIALHRYGAPIDLADVHGAYPLHYATVSSSTAVEEEVPLARAEAILHTLLRKGVPLECADIDGRTPLLWAASDGNLSAFCTLIQAGANQFATDRDGLGVIHCAASHGHAHILREMLSLLVGQSAAIAVDAKDRNSDTPLFYAATFGHWQCAKLLLEKGANANHKDKRNRTAAHCAAAKGQMRVLKLLRQFGANLNLQNYRGDLPFHEAVQTGIKEVVEWFLDIDPNFISAPNFCGRISLHLAASKGSKELVDLLCIRGAPTNALMMNKGQLLTPLDVAKRRGHKLIIEYLIGACDALSADDVPSEDRNIQRKSIEQQMEKAKVRKTRIELTEDEEMAGDEALSLLRRGNSFWEKGSAGREMVDASTTMSRRSSSASGSFYFKKKVPRATSTTDLAQMAPTNTQKMAKTFNQQQEEGQKREEAQNRAGRAEMEQTIQRIVKEELRKVKEVGEERQGETWRGGQGHADSAGNGESAREKEDEEAEEEDGEHQQNIMPKQHNVTAKFRAKHSARERTAQKNDQTNGENDSEKEIMKKVQGKIGEGGTEGKRIRRRMTPRGTERAEERGEEEAGVTELHILEQGMYPPMPHNQQLIGRMAEFAEPSPTEQHAPRSSIARRYIHEKAIFDELTHLKRMQLQYRRVSEDVLVRSLVQNFCRMHSIHPAHFRRVHTFHHWEKFLYDQLKLIYLEERDRISAAAAAASQKSAAAAGGVGAHPMALYSAQQRVFTASALTGGAAPTSAFIQRRFDARILPRTDPLEERMNELSRIYGSGSSSQNSGMQMLEEEHQQRRARNGKENGMRKRVTKEKGEERVRRRAKETEEGESHL
ncbi:hypothetical protein niasHT_015878 [Heterodera trifolii]|uniref:ANK_REP_REGION domain-containing protein n=1 Tax=Heterodera trifolii TaxID=157864 RepID=A0ABD2LLJ8_9BILA